jgi:integral membrane protein
MTLTTAVRCYRTMAYITGCLIIVIVCAGLPLQFAFSNIWIDQYVGTVHGYLYIVYIIAAFILSQKLKMRLSPRVFLLLLAGTIPVLTFVVERWMNRAYIQPALAAEAAGRPIPQHPAAK